MRFFLHSQWDWDWFLFLDDDVYLRPYALVSLLQQFDSPNSSSLYSPSASFLRDGRGRGGRHQRINQTLVQVGKGPVALLSSNRYRGLTGSGVLKQSTGKGGKGLRGVKGNKLGNEAPFNCSVKDVHDFAFAQPAIINR
jgi:hypothetical protein